MSNAYGFYNGTEEGLEDAARSLSCDFAMLSGRALPESERQRTKDSLRTLQ